MGKDFKIKSECKLSRRIWSIIIGVDSGTTSAYAVVDYDGRVLAALSRKHWPKHELRAQIARYNPAIIASDKANAVKLAREFSTDFNARLFSPKYDLTHVEKADLTRKFHFRNRHERDAAASALKAYHSVENKLRQVARHVAAEGNWQDVTAIRAGVIRGASMHDLLQST